jgi:hypothetical protein
MGLVYGWLVVCVPAHQSITELARVLGVSKASVSTTVRQLQSADMLERVPVPGTRQHHDQLCSGGGAKIIRTRFSRMAPVVAAADAMLSRVRTADPSRVERLEELRDFFAIVEVDTDLLTGRWEEYLEHAIAEREHARPRRRPGPGVRGRG